MRKAIEHSMGFGIRYRLMSKRLFGIGLLLGSVLQQLSGLLHSKMGLYGMILSIASPPWPRFFTCTLVRSSFFFTILTYRLLECLSIEKTQIVIFQID